MKPSRASLLVLSSNVAAELRATLVPDDEVVAFLKRTKASSLKSLSLTRLESLQRLDELCAWLHIYRRPGEAMAVGKALLAFPFTGDYTRYGPVESALALTAWLAQETGEIELARSCTDHIDAVYGRREDWAGSPHEDAMMRRLGGFLVEWQENNATLATTGQGRISYRLAQLGELALLAHWGGSEAWPVKRIRAEFADKTAYLRAKKI